jgi:hypothetical protein
MEYAMNVKTLAVMATALLGPGFCSVAEAAQTPNFYNCTGKNVSLTLAVGSKAEVGILPAETLLNLKIGKKDYAYHEADITTESTLIGDLWEVTTAFLPDVHIDHASVVIPKISLGQAPIKFSSQLILTRVATPFIATPYEGIVNTSRYIDLSCTASMVYY